MKMGCFILLALLTGASGLARAEIIEVQVDGVVTWVHTVSGFELDGSVEVGTQMSGFCRYDTLSPDMQPLETIGTYNMLDLSLSIGNYTFMHDAMSSGVPLFEVAYNESTFGYVATTHDPAFEGTMFYNDTALTFDELEWTTFMLALISLRGPIWPGATDALPDADSFLPLPFFTERNSFSVSIDEDRYFRIYGEVTLLRVVPEPGTVALLSLGGLVVFRRRRSR